MLEGTEFIVFVGYFTPSHVMAGVILNCNKLLIFLIILSSLP